ncbi:MAG TPA: hypothetical protein VIT44_17400 [Cyclobacteriaceae bacterium]
MNKLFFYVVVLLSTFYSSYAQRKSDQKQIDPSEIPSAVKTSQSTSFPTVTVSRWEVRDVIANRKYVTKYVAVFEADDNTIRARYKGDGTLVSSSKYFDGEHAPSQIKNLGSKYNEYTLKNAEEIKTYSKGRVFYRAHFYKGKKKTLVYTDDSGKEIANDKVLAEVKEEEDI